MTGDKPGRAGPTWTPRRALLAALLAAAVVVLVAVFLVVALALAALAAVAALVLLARAKWRAARRRRGTPVPRTRRDAGAQGAIDTAFRVEPAGPADEGKGRA